MLMVIKMILFLLQHVDGDKDGDAVSTTICYGDKDDAVCTTIC